MLGFNNISVLVGHFVSRPSEREKKESKRDEREVQGRKRNRNEREEMEEKKFSPLLLPAIKDSQPCPAVSQYQMDTPVRPTPDHPPRCTQKQQFSYFFIKNICFGTGNH